MKAFLESANAPGTTFIKVTILSQGRVFCEIPEGQRPRSEARGRACRQCGDESAQLHR
jgi:hypothetical protein